jgi:DNA modification methylase
MRPGKLYFGDNLLVLKEYVADESIDLVYLDPPWNSNQDFNVLFKERDLTSSDAQLQAFEDCWHWDQKAQTTYEELIAPDAIERGIPRSVSILIEAFYRALPQRSDMAAYLVMMAPRLVELRRVLTPRGSLYLHCDPTASHYLKLLLDAIFGPQNFANEIAWQRTNARTAAGRWPRVHDVLLFYAKDTTRTFNPVQVIGEATKQPHTLVTGPDGKRYQSYELTAPHLRFGETGKAWRGFQPADMGRCWANPPPVMDEWDRQGLIHWPKKKGAWPRRRAAEPFAAEKRMVTVGDVWTDVDRINQSAKERIGYPTQKPLALLERILSASSNPGDVVLDPFCGCGTTIEAAQKLGREWIGIDITHLAIRVIRDRLASKFPGIKYELLGEPQDVESARVLAETSPYQFQWWAVHRIGAHPIGAAPGSREGKKGRDRGVDGLIKFRVGSSVYEIVVSVKSGRAVTPGMVRDLHGTVQSEKAALGVLVTMQPPTQEMRTAAARAGTWRDPSTDRKYARVQILSAVDLFAGRVVEHPGIEIAERTPAAGQTLALPGMERPAPPPRKGVIITVPENAAEAPTPLLPLVSERKAPLRAEPNKKSKNRDRAS